MFFVNLQKLLQSKLILGLVLCSLGCNFLFSDQSKLKPLKTPDGKYMNPYMEHTKTGVKQVLKWKLQNKSQANVKKLHKTLSIQKADLNLIKYPGKQPQVTWIGHSTVLVQHQGKNWITDPVFSKRVSPVPGVGPKRYTPPALKISELPKLDYVLISHNHYDHLDAASVKAIGNQPLWLVPEGLKSWFVKKGITNVIELSWWETHEISGIKFTCTPTQHWSKRTLKDTYKSLWCSWAVKASGFSFWFGGDTGYNERQFKEIGQECGGFDAAFIPIGSYAPRWFMKAHHIDPYEAVQIHKEVNSKWSLGIHWGTFVLSDEPINEPPQKLQEALIQAGLDTEEFQAMGIGQTKVIKLES